MASITPAQLARYLESPIAEVAELAAEVERLQKDAARLDFLNTCVNGTSYAVQLERVRDTAKYSGMNRYVVTTLVGSGQWERRHEEFTLRAALDAGIGEVK